MCGIVAAIAQRDVLEILLEGLRRLEYRGYDSAGLAVKKDNKISRIRANGKVSELSKQIETENLPGHVGIAHTRWATHGIPAVKNAHPHMYEESIALVHNGIIENYEKLKEQLKAENIVFNSDTDTETIVHLIGKYRKQGNDLLSSVNQAITKLEGSYALAVIDLEEQQLVVARKGSPLVIGLGIGENFIASDVAALLPVTQKFIILEEGDVAQISQTEIKIYNEQGEPVERKARLSELTQESAERGKYRHFMLKEIYEQPRAISETLEGRIDTKNVLIAAFGFNAEAIFKEIDSVTIVACGTSYHAGLVAKYWLEEMAEIPCQVEVASEFRYRKVILSPNTLLLTISQSGETADTLAALSKAKKQGIKYSLTICNVAESSLTRESALTFLTHAGPEIGVASTKAFSTQLVALLLMTLSIAKAKGNTSYEQECINELRNLPKKITSVLKLEQQIEDLSVQFADKRHALFLGRGTQYPIAQEGALKIKEISYIHAEAYPAGELKHGPLALVDEDMPVIAVAPNNDLIGKLKANLEEVKARGGQLYIFADENVDIKSEENMELISLGKVEPHTSPIVFAIILQLLSYHVALIKGTDVDQPRNLAKSVTVE
ncbi:MAG: glutamine--fructose-6-phosphate transaminase (isomerizing) [Pseudomonadota bacterium]